MPILLQFTNATIWESSSNDHIRSSTVSCLGCIRNSLQSRCLSDKAISLLCASWRSNTESSCSSSWRRIWEKWCTSEGVNPLRECFGITDQFHPGKTYSTLNTYRSTISITRMPLDGFQIGKHPLISQLMKGVYHRCPPQPKNTGRWDVKPVYWIS